MSLIAWRQKWEGAAGQTMRGRRRLAQTDGRERWTERGGGKDGQREGEGRRRRTETGAGGDEQNRGQTERGEGEEIDREEMGIERGKEEMD